MDEIWKGRETRVGPAVLKLTETPALKGAQLQRFVFWKIKQFKMCTQLLEKMEGDTRNIQFTETTMQPLQ